MGNRLGECDTSTRTNSFAHFPIFLPGNIGQFRALNVFLKGFVLRTKGSPHAIPIIRYSFSKPKTRQHKITRNVQNVVFSVCENFNRLCRCRRSSHRNRSHRNCGPISDAGIGSIIQFSVTISKGNSDSRTTCITLRPEIKTIHFETEIVIQIFRYGCYIFRLFA